MDKKVRQAEKTLRIGLGATILWFGISQLLSPSDWVGYLPGWVFAQTVVSAIVFIIINGVFETVTGLMLITNQFSKVVSVLLSLHMVLIIFHLGYNDLAVRDFGILVGLIALYYLSDNTSILNKKKG